MNKKYGLLIVIFVFLVAVIGMIVYWATQKPEQTETNPTAPTAPAAEMTPDPKNAGYSVGGKPITLMNGISEIEIPESAARIVTRYFGNEVRGDFNGDGKIDVALILTQSSGGSGTFYYAAALLSGNSGYQGTEAVLLGDRIAPQPINFINGEIVVNYADRKTGEPMTAAPSVGVSRYFLVDNGRLREIIKTMTESEARAIAQAACIKGGEALSTGIYNENSKTWWFDANLNAVKPGCNPVCVVSAEKKTAQINWRCTGAIPPENNFIACSAESRQGDVCAEIYAPVCATVQIQCIKAPCDPIKQTFPNACAACHNPLVSGYTMGECPITGS